MSTHQLAGKAAPPELLIDVLELEHAYYEREPDPDDPAQRVAFGTSGHRGSSLDSTFNEAHILAITQAICDYRRANGVDGPLFLGKDSHALSSPASRDAVEVLAANSVELVMQCDDGMTPTPVISRSILQYNRGGHGHLADGIVLTPSHNPPRDGGIKYNPPSAGPAETEVTNWIQDRANELIRGGNSKVKRVSFDWALKCGTTHARDLAGPYIRDLSLVIDTDVIRSSGITIGVDPLGGSAVGYWEPISELYGLNVEVVNPRVDPTFSFMTVDHDGKIRMDCSSPYAMARLVKLKYKFDIAFGNDPDADRHGIVTRSMGLMNPNQYLAAAIHYLLSNRNSWRPDSAVGKTLVSSNLIDLVASEFNRKVLEVPVGFKWFVEGLLNGSVCFGGEESAGASFLQKDASAWVTEKDGIVLGLLAAEILARTGKDPGEHYLDIAARLGKPYYVRIDAPATPEQKDAIKRLSAEDVSADELAGDPIIAKLTRAPGNNSPIGGLKVITRGGWFAARPSGTENVYKLYAESFKSEQHLALILAQARQIVSQAIAAGKS